MNEYLYIILNFVSLYTLGFNLKILHHPKYIGILWKNIQNDYIDHIK